MINNTITIKGNTGTYSYSSDTAFCKLYKNISFYQGNRIEDDCTVQIIQVRCPSNFKYTQWKRFFSGCIDRVIQNIDIIQISESSEEIIYLIRDYKSLTPLNQNLKNNPGIFFDRPLFSLKEIIKIYISLADNAKYHPIVVPSIIYIGNDNSIIFDDVLSTFITRFSTEESYDFPLTLSMPVCLDEIFLSPEYIAGNWEKFAQAPLIFSLGILMLYLLTRENPFIGLLGANRLAKILQGSIDVRVSSKYKNIIKKATRQNPRKRYQSLMEFLLAIEDCEKDIDLPLFKRIINHIRFQR